MVQGKIFLLLFLLPSMMILLYVIFQIALKVLSPCITWKNTLQLKNFFGLFLDWNRIVTVFRVRWMETWPLLWSFKSYVILTKSLWIFLGLVFHLWCWNNYGCLNKIIYGKHFLQDSWHLVSTKCYQSSLDIMHYEYKAYCKNFPVISYIFIGFFGKTLTIVF